MKQIIQSYRTGELWLAEVPAPALRGSSGAIVHTAASLVSAGTERMIIELAKKSLLGKARARPDLVRKVIDKIKSEGLAQTMEKVFAKLDSPIPLGYSCSGVVIEVGSGNSGLKPGDRVACGGAGYATHADLNYVPKNLIVKIPDQVSFEDACFTTVGAIAMQGVRQADVRLGERIVVIGLGLIGLLTVQILKAAGCQVIGSDLDPAKCQLAKELGADRSASADLADVSEAFTHGHGADAVIITAATPSNQPIETAAEIARVKGRVVIVGMVGMDVPRDPFYKKELDLRLSMSYGPGRYDTSYEEGGIDYPIGYVRWTEQRNMASIVDLLAAGKVTPSRLVTHRFQIDKALEAYALLESGSQPYLGIVIHYSDHGPIQPSSASRTIELSAVEASSRQINVGFIGAGNFARGVLIPTLRKIGGVGLAGICTATGISGTETARKHGFAYATTDYQKLLGDPGINAVFITTRHDTHARFACDGLESGKHVFVEKPMCVRREEISDYQRAIEKHPDRCLMVGFNRRFSPHTLAIRDAFASRSTPMVITYRVNAGLVPKDAWIQDEQIGGGRIVGEVCHFVDWCEFITRSVPLNVQAESIASDDQRIHPEDSVVVTIRYADGSLATIQYVSLGPSSMSKERAEVFADGTSAVLDDFKTTSFFGCKRPTLKTAQDKGFVGEIAAFLNAITRGGEAPISFASMARTTRVTFAILDSLRSGTVQSIHAIEASGK